MLLIGLFYLIFPTLMLALLAFKRQPNRLMWFLTSLLAGVSILFIWTIARWEIVSVFWRPVFPILFFVAVWVSFRKIDHSVMPSKRVYWINVFINTSVIFVMSVFCFLALRGYRVPTDTIALESPLRDGEYIVLHGGSRPMVNAHFYVTPQNYALDIVALDQWGRRGNSIAGGPVLTDYHIYEKPVYSPCDGQVILLVDQFKDQIPPLVDTKNIAGNHLLIQCGDNEVLLAHLQQGSFKVKQGDIVTTETQVAKVGNSGNSSEPHLHMHVETGGEPNKILNGKGVAFTLKDKFLLRGDRL